MKNAFEALKKGLCCFSSRLYTLKTRISDVRELHIDVTYFNFGLLMLVYFPGIRGYQICQFCAFQRETRVSRFWLKRPTSTCAIWSPAHFRQGSIDIFPLQTQTIVLTTDGYVEVAHYSALYKYTES